MIPDTLHQRPVQIKPNELLIILLPIMNFLISLRVHLNIPLLIQLQLEVKDNALRLVIGALEIVVVADIAKVFLVVVVEGAVRVVFEFVVVGFFGVFFDLGEGGGVFYDAEAAVVE